jgi:hypothetical protein
MSLAQRDTHKVLGRLILDANGLVRRCPLDYTRHDTSLSSQIQCNNLGTFDRLPAELQHLILEELDLQSLLTFRRMNRKALHFINNLSSWRKILVHAPNTIRMAIGLKVASRFSLKHLFEVLCEKHCPSCGKFAPMINIFTLQRLCYSVRGGCSARNGSDDPTPTLRERLLGWFPELESSIDQIPSFRAITGRCGSAVIRSPSTLYSMAIAAELSAQFKTPNSRSVQGEWINPISNEGIWIEEAIGARMTSVLSPWLSNSSMEAENAAICGICLGEARAELWHMDEISRMYSLPKFVVYDGDALRRHLEEQHAQDLVRINERRYRQDADFWDCKDDGAILDELFI